MPFKRSSSITDICKYFESICVVKEHKDEKLGIVVKRSSILDTLYISEIKDTSKFAGSKLQVGMVILTINTVSPKTVKEVQTLMEETEGDLTIMAATIIKDIDIGIRPRRPSNTSFSEKILKNEPVLDLPLSGVISCYVAMATLMGFAVYSAPSA
ncbi:unnamed protein product [Cylindrotheca closterium]|uniref:PDZ domain-containing protein n=1 Tax=Cylindrotheca closterium TaxID=2856 RepID=A0AAD2FXM6_9STRA|nr:unnamed protein product [Cylindrotheca closterium]